MISYALSSLYTVFFVHCALSALCTVVLSVHCALSSPMHCLLCTLCTVLSYVLSSLYTVHCPLLCTVRTIPRDIEPNVQGRKEDFRRCAENASVKILTGVNIVFVSVRRLYTCKSLAMVRTVQVLQFKCQSPKTQKSARTLRRTRLKSSHRKTLYLSSIKLYSKLYLNKCHIYPF